MRNRLAQLAVHCLCGALCAAGVAAQDGPSIVDVTPGVFAVLQPAPLRFADSNSAVIVNEHDLIVVDTQGSLAATRQTIAAIRERTSKPVAYLVYSHWHGDHVLGAQAYREAFPDVQFIGHSSLAADLPGRASEQFEKDIERMASAIEGARGRLAQGVDRNGLVLDADAKKTLSGQIDRAVERLDAMKAIPLPLAPPDLTFDDTMSIRREGREIRLIHYRAHTPGDTIVYLPADRVLISGDVLDDLPFGGHGYPTSWIETLNELQNYDFDKTVPGHGSVRQGKEHLATVLAMLESIVEQTKGGIAEGQDLEAIQGAIDLATYHEQLVGDDDLAGRAFDDFIPATIERVWLEERGELTEVP